jgi:hypothetical protein
LAKVAVIAVVVVGEEVVAVEVSRVAEEVSRVAVEVTKVRWRSTKVAEETDRGHRITRRASPAETSQ